MTNKEKIIKYIDNALLNYGLVATYNDYQPTLQFGLSNNDTGLPNCVKVSSIDEAEDLVTEFISTAPKGKIFDISKIDINSDLYLIVGLILPS